MRRIVLFALVAVMAWFAVAAPAHAGDVRVEVATLDGAPVYHWRFFKSVLSDDVDRTLVLREFQRKGFKIPQKLVDEAVQLTTTEDFGGDTNKLARHLRQEGASVDDFRRFTTEEITVKAMLYQIARNDANRARLQVNWLAKLRAGAVVKRPPTKGKTIED